MKKFMFLVAFLVGFSFVSQAYSQTWATASPEPHGQEPDVIDILPTDPMPDPQADEAPDVVIGDEDVPLADNESSDSAVVKNRSFTPAEAADATKNNNKNSVTINF